MNAAPAATDGARRISLRTKLAFGVGSIAESAIYIAFNEGPQNWQSLWTCAAYLVLGVTLLRPRAVTFTETADNAAPAVAIDPRI